MNRPAEHYLHGDGRVVVIPQRVCAWLERYAGLDEFRRAHRGADPEVDAVLTAMRIAALNWRSSATGTRDDPEPEPAASLPWLTTTQAANRAHVTDRAVRKAIQTGQLAATDIAGRWRINRIDFEHWNAARAA